MLEKSLVERAGGGFGERGADGSSSLGCEGVKKRRSLEGKAYFFDRGIWARSHGVHPLVAELGATPIPIGNENTYPLETAGASL